MGQKHRRRVLTEWRRRAHRAMSVFRGFVMRPIVLIFLAVNAGVFALRMLLGESQFMIDNFLVSWSGLAAGRYWTVVTSAFSHVLLLHFFVNMYVLASFGPIVEYAIGSVRFFFFYFF